jgi:hypothetical protein
MKNLYVLKYKNRQTTYDLDEVSEKTICAFVIVASDEEEARTMAVNVAYSESARSENHTQFQPMSWKERRFVECQLMGRSEAKIAGVVAIGFGLKREDGPTAA